MPSLWLARRQRIDTQPHGGRFGVAEGLDIIDTIVKLVDMAADSGATVCATRDYHPIDHV